MYVMSIDAGTGSGRAVIFDAKGNQIAIAQQEWLHVSESGVPNSMGFDYEKNWNIICDCIKSVINKAGIRADAIKAVSATSMREGIVVYDQWGKELFALANVDARSGEEVKQINREYPDLEREYYNISGQTFALGALPRLLWIQNNKPQLYEKIASINMISDWVLTKLSGVIAAEPSNAGTSGIFNLQTRQWEPQMARKLGLKDDIFPPVYETGTVIGEVHAVAAQESGLAVGTKVVMGGGDVQLGSAGLGVVEAGACAVLGGTFWQQIVNIEGSVVHPNMDIRINPHVIPGMSQAEGITFFSGLVMRWFRDTFCESEKAAALKEGVDAYAYMERLAQAVSVGSHGIMPIFSDIMKYGTWYHAAPSFINLSLETTNKAAMFRALEENAAIVSMLNLRNIFAFIQSEPQSITFAGGAAKGALWSQILADVTGKTVRIPDVTEATALGGAMACSVALGWYDSMAECAKAWVHWSKTYDPNRAHHQLYAEIAERWREIYAQQLALVDSGLTTSMWRAPGL